jgi:hypothetical protein
MQRINQPTYSQDRREAFLQQAIVIRQAVCELRALAEDLHQQATTEEDLEGILSGDELDEVVSLLSDAESTMDREVDIMDYPSEKPSTWRAALPRDLDAVLDGDNLPDFLR